MKTMTPEDLAAALRKIVAQECRRSLSRQPDPVTRAELKRIRARVLVLLDGQMEPQAQAANGSA